MDDFIRFTILILLCGTFASKPKPPQQAISPMPIPTKTLTRIYEMRDLKNEERSVQFLGE